MDVKKGRGKFEYGKLEANKEIWSASSVELKPLM